MNEEQIKEQLRLALRPGNILNPSPTHTIGGGLLAKRTITLEFTDDFVDRWAAFIHQKIVNHDDE